jgi:hypothetical protein
MVPPVLSPWDGAGCNRSWSCSTLGRSWTEAAAAAPSCARELLLAEPRLCFLTKLRKLRDLGNFGRGSRTGGSRSITKQVTSSRRPLASRAFCEHRPAFVRLIEAVTVGTASLDTGRQHCKKVLSNTARTCSLQHTVQHVRTCQWPC